MSTKYTFNGRHYAHTMQRNDTVRVPDQVAQAQKDFDGLTFPVLRKDGRRARATLRGEEYGLHTPGTGDMVVSMA